MSWQKKINVFHIYKSTYFEKHVPICKGMALIFLLFCYRFEILLKKWNHYVNKYSIHVSSMPYFTSFSCIFSQISYLSIQQLKFPPAFINRHSNTSLLDLLSTLVCPQCPKIDCPKGLIPDVLRGPFLLSLSLPWSVPVESWPCTVPVMLVPSLRRTCCFRALPQPQWAVSSAPGPQLTGTDTFHQHPGWEGVISNFSLAPCRNWSFPMGFWANRTDCQTREPCS